MWENHLYYILKSVLVVFAGRFAKGHSMMLTSCQHRRFHNRRNQRTVTVSVLDSYLGIPRFEYLHGYFLPG